ncbi:helix-turn-helix transcriptional regulator [Streptacidiphilus cavernicola]|uniref:Helix-turn-helix transcriptional regulator n=1 Tax=Streptacidiphilus cavernicola TaxID=3342716 RepID=A0ABV6VYG6_9ACTN
MSKREPDPWTSWVETQRKQVGDRLRSLREAQDLTQEAVALRAGLDRTTVSAAELAINAMTIDTAQRIARVLGVPVTSLFAPEWSMPTDGDTGPGEAVWDPPEDDHA